MEIVFITIRNFWSVFKTSKEIFFEKMIRLTIYLAVFLIPLICMPLNDSFIAYSKVVLFYIIVSLGFIFWLIKIYFSKKIRLEMFILDIPIIIFIFIYLLSSLFSINRFHSFLGTYLNISATFLTTLFLAGFYCLVSRFFYNLKKIRKLFFLLNISIFSVLLFNLINVFLSLALFLLFSISITTLNFLLVIGVILSGILFFSSGTKLERVINLVFSILYILALYILHNQIALLLLILAIFFFILLSSFKSQYFSSKVVVSLTLLLLITVIALVLPLNNLFNIQSPLELGLSNSLGWKITKSTLQDYSLLGVGPDNFSYSFYKYKPIEYNLSALWQLGFEKNSNFWLEILNNIGFLGLLLIIILFIKYFWHFKKFVKNIEITDESSNTKLILTIGITVIILTFIIFGCLNNYVFVVIFLFTLFLALACGLLSAPLETKSITNKNIVNILVYLSVLLLLIIFFYGIQLVWADVVTVRTTNTAYAKIEDFNLAENNLRRAIIINPYRLDYKIALANILINKELYYQGSQQEYNQEELRLEIVDILSQVLHSPVKKIDSFIWLNKTYRVLKTMGYQTYEMEAMVNQRLLDLDPFNPELYLDRALLNFQIYSALKNNEGQIPDRNQEIDILLKKIKADLEKSIELKNNYAPGYYNLGLYYTELGDLVKSREYIEKAFSFDPQERMITESLKTIYLNNKEYNKAIEVLNKYLEYNHDDLTLRLELANLYYNTKNLEQTREQINIILELDQENTQAKALLQKIE